MVPPADLDRLSPAELKSLVIQQFEVIAELQRTVSALRDEIARLKGAQLEIRVDGKVRSYRDLEEVALNAANFLKRLYPNSEVAVHVRELAS
jgi:hypothetical protein